MSRRGLLAGIAVSFAMAAGGAQASYRYGGYYDDGRGYRDIIRCESRNGRTAYCRVDTRAGVRLINQSSQRACIRGRTWGVNRDYIWVSRGCRARFEVGDSRYGYGYGRDRYNRDRYYDDRYDRGYRDNRYYDNRYYDGRGYAAARVLRCESHDGRYNFCDTYGSTGRVEIRRQLSDASCRRNLSWGYRSGGVWVDRGCRAEFILY